ncbi:hypothetical protein [Actinophytocola sp.]|uniref:hypothetical protein n=1 Tax=Actinophytocola sp. TaxID=1872138 RepID=UPI003D6BE112
MPKQSPATDYAIALLHVANSTGGANSPDESREIAPAVIDHVLRPALADSEIDWTRCTAMVQGDRISILASPDVPKTAFVEVLPNRLTAALHRYAETVEIGPATRFRLMLDTGDVSGESSGADSAVDSASRLLDAVAAEPESARSAGGLDVVLSSRLYHEVVAGDSGVESYRKVTVSDGDGSVEVWVRSADAADASLAWLDALPTEHPAIHEFLQRCAFFGSAPIVLAWFAGTGTAAPTPAELSAALRAGIERGLVTVDDPAGAVRIHPLVRAVLRGRMTAEQREGARLDDAGC